MYLKRKMVLLTIPSVLVIAFLSCMNQRSVVAKIGHKYAISIDDLEKYIYKDQKQFRNSPPTFSEAKDFLNKLIDEKILILTAYQRKLDRDSLLLTQIESQNQTWMIDELYQRLNIEPCIKEWEIRGFYSRMAKTVVVRSILFQLPQKTNKKDEKIIVEKAETVLKMLNSGEDFSNLAMRYSEDKTKASKGGLIGTLSWILADDPIRKAAFSMKKGQYSGLIRNQNGINIIYIDEIKETRKLSLNLVRDDIIKQFKNERREQIRKQQTKVEKQIDEDIGIHWQESGLDTLCNYLKNEKVNDRENFKSCIKNLTQNQKETKLAHYYKGKFTIEEFNKMIEDLPVFSSFRRPTNKDQLKRIIELKLFVDRLLEIAKKGKLDQSASVKEQRRQFVERTILDQLIQKEIYNTINPTKDNVKTFYEQEKNQLYSEPATIRIQEILVQNESLANQIYNMALTGIDFGKLVNKYSIRQTYRSTNGIMPEMKKGEGGNLGDIGFAMRIDEISKPVLSGDGKFSIVKLLEKKAAVEKPFNQIEDLVTRDYINIQREEKKSTYINKQKEGYGGIVVFDKILEQYFHE